MFLPITSFYAALVALTLLTLSIRVILYRRTHRLGLGDYGDKALLTRMRAQANCAEYGPVGVVLMLLLEPVAAPVLIHALGIMLVAGRAAHAVGFSRYPQIMGLRIVGMVATLAMIAIAALALLWSALA